MDPSLDVSTPRSQLRLDPQQQVHAGLGRAFADVLAYACQQGGRVSQRPVVAVHEYRKSIRRARALVRLLRAPGWRELDVELRDAVRATSILRDRDVLLAAVDNLPPGPETEALRRVIKLQRADGDPCAVLTEGVERLLPLPARWVAGLCPTLGRADLRKAVGRSFARAQDARRRVKRSGVDEDLHRWRKRVKELRYQLELLGAKQAGPGQSLHASLVSQATSLGELTDHTVMHGFALTHRAEIGPVEGLVSTLQERVQTGLRALLACTAVEYEARPKVYARQALGSLRAPTVSDS